MNLKAEGFSLLELMIVVAIIAILVTIAYPSYEEYVLRANRTEAKNLVMRVASEEEKFYSTFNRYSGSMGARTTDPATSGLNITASTSSGSGDNAYYDVAIALTNGTQGYTITATPRGSQQSDDRCGPMAITHLGVKTASEERCW